MGYGRTCYLPAAGRRLCRCACGELHVSDTAHVLGLEYKSSEEPLPPAVLILYRNLAGAGASRAKTSAQMLTLQFEVNVPLKRGFPGLHEEAPARDSPRASGLAPFP